MNICVFMGVKAKWVVKASLFPARQGHATQQSARAAYFTRGRGAVNTITRTVAEVAAFDPEPCARRRVRRRQRRGEGGGDDVEGRWLLKKHRPSLRGAAGAFFFLWQRVPIEIKARTESGTGGGRLVRGPPHRVERIHHKCQGV